MAKRIVGLKEDPIEIEVVFTREDQLVRERTIDTGSPALVRLIDVMSIIEQYQEDALRYRELMAEKHV